jgi:acetoacetyl-CoA reductase
MRRRAVVWTSERLCCQSRCAWVYKIDGAGSSKIWVTVNTVPPGYISTEMVMTLPEKIREQIVAQIPVGRLGCIEGIAEAVSCLLSDRLSFITASNLCINSVQHMY